MIYDLDAYLSPINIAQISGDAAYNDSQFGRVIKIYEEEIPDLSDVDIVIVGINEFRGNGFIASENSADVIRKKFYELHYWHREISIADIGNIKSGNSINDSYHALSIVLKEMFQLNKTVVIIGGSHDNTLAQYFAYKDLNKIIDATVVDATIDLRSESVLLANK